MAKKPSTSPRVNQKKAATDAAYIVMGGELITPAAYRNSLEQAWNQALSGANISTNVRADAYGISAVAYAASNYSAQVVSEIPLMLVKPDGTEADFNPVPHFFATYKTLFWHVQIAVMIFGVAYLRKVYNAYGYPAGLEWIHPDDINVQADMKGQVIEYYIDGVRHMPSQLVEIRSFDPKRTLDGKGEFEVALSRMTTEQSIVRHAGSFFFNAARPDGMLVSKSKMNPGDIKRAEQEWKRFKESKNAWKTFVSSGQWEWIPVTAQPVDLAMTELSQDVKRDICAIMKVNPALLGFADVSDPLSAGSTFQEIKKNHILDVAIPRFETICRHLNEQWLYTDFGHGGLYSLAANQKGIPGLSELTQDKANTAITLAGPGAVIIDYHEARGSMGLDTREDYIKRNPAELTTIFNSTALLMDEYRRMLGLEPLGINLGGALVRLPSGALVNAWDLPKIADASAKQIIDPPAPAPAFPFGGGLSLPTPSPIQQAPALPAPPVTDSDLGKLARLIITSRRSRPGVGSCAVLLSFAGDPAIEAVQTILANQIDLLNPPIEWIKPADYHLTLIYADSLSDESERILYDTLAALPPLTIQTAGVGYFDKEDATPIVLLVESDDTLKSYQTALYDKAYQLGATLSDYSDPQKFTPHITLGYAPAGYKPPDMPVKVKATPACIQFSREVYQITYERPTPPPDSIPDGGGVNTVAEATRRAAAADVSLLWPENNFILMAQRVAARALQEAGVLAVSWFEPRNWRLDIAHIDATPGAVAKMVNEFNFGDLAKLELTGAGYRIHGSTIYLMCNPSDGLERFRQTVRLELEEFDLLPDNSDFVGGIALGRFEADSLKPMELMDSYNALNACSDGLGMPIVGSGLAVLVNDESRHIWTLRSHNAAQMSELNTWRKKATGRRGALAPFETYALTGSLVESYTRHALNDLEDISDAAAVHGVFIRAQQLLTDGLTYADDLPPTPEEYNSYWHNYDDIQTDIGAAWLHYMESALPDVIEQLEVNSDPVAIMQVMDKFHAGLVDEWIGTDDQPGELVKVILAGMAAGNEALQQPSDMNPARAAGFGLDIAWDLMSQEAYNFARKYAYNLIRGIDQTTQNEVKKIVSEWIQSGEPTKELARRLTPVFQDKKRAKLIAQTESIRVYNEGAFERWRQVGVKKAIWRTVRDKRVCPICYMLNGQEGDIDAGWIHPGGTLIDPDFNRRINADMFRGRVYRDSAHPGCRCFRRPVVIKTADNKPVINPQTETVKATEAAGVPIEDLLKRYEADAERIRAAIQKERARIEQERVKVRGQIEASLAARQDLLNKMSDQYELYRNIPEGDIEAETANKAARDAIRKQLDDNAKAEKRLRDKLQRFDDKMRDKVTSIIAVGSDATINTRPGLGKVTKVMQSRAEKAKAWLSQVIDGDKFDSVDVAINRTGSRAHYTRGAINMTHTSGIDIYIHEIGHAIEDKYPDVLDRLNQFLDYRTKGETAQPLSQLTNNANYGAREIAKPDKFIHPYMGKIYESKDKRFATEILSMGLELMYRNPTLLLEQDPELFNFILGILRRIT